MPHSLHLDKGNGRAPIHYTMLSELEIAACAIYHLTYAISYLALPSGVKFSPHEASRNCPTPDRPQNGMDRGNTQHLVFLCTSRIHRAARSPLPSSPRRPKSITSLPS